MSRSYSDHVALLLGLRLELDAVEDDRRLMAAYGRALGNANTKIVGAPLCPK